MQSDFQHAHFLTDSHECLSGFVRGFGARAHQNDDTLGCGMADVLEQLVAPAGQLTERLHRAFDDPRARVVEAIRGLPRLEKDVRVLSGSTEHWTVGCERALAMGEDRRFCNERP
jgi:hypothetical protein